MASEINLTHALYIIRSNGESWLPPSETTVVIAIVPPIPVHGSVCSVVSFLLFRSVRLYSQPERHSLNNIIVFDFILLVDCTLLVANIRYVDTYSFYFVFFSSILIHKKLHYICGTSVNFFI